MTTAIAQIDVPKERQQAKLVAQSTYIPVGEHMSGTFTNTETITFTTPEDAQFLKLQSLGQANLRYRIDGLAPTIATGFQLASGSDVLIPVAVQQIIIVGESAGNYEAQWVR